MKNKQLLCFLLFTVALSACSNFTGGVAVIPTQVITNTGIEAISKKYQNAVCTDTGTGCSQVGAPRAGSWIDQINKCQKVSRDLDECKIFRNAIINELILIVNHNYHAYEGGMIAGKARNNFYTGALRTSLETAGALITVADTTKVLSGLAAFTGTIHESSDKEFFFDNTIDALIIQMRADRAKALFRLLEGRDADYASYSIETAIGDITDYYRAGTLASAIVSISKSASAEETTAIERLDTLR